MGFCCLIEVHEETPAVVGAFVLLVDTFCIRPACAALLRHGRLLLEDSLPLRQCCISWRLPFAKEVIHRHKSPFVWVLTSCRAAPCSTAAACAVVVVLGGIIHTSVDRACLTVFST